MAEALDPAAAVAPTQADREPNGLDGSAGADWRGGPMGVGGLADRMEGEDHLPPEVDEWLSWLATERGRAPSTLEAYRRDVRRWLAWLVVVGRTLGDIDEAVIEAFVGHLRDEGLAPATAKRRVVAVRSLYRFLAEEGSLPSDPGADVAAPQVPAALPKALTEEEVATLLGAVVGDEPAARRDRAILEVLYGTGLRISELVGLSLGDVDIGQHLLRAFGKGSKERLVPLGRHAEEALEAWLSPAGRGALEPAQWARRGDAEAVFLNRRGRRLTRQGAWLVVKRHGDAVGLGERLSPHVLRHSCATHMLDHGADIRAVQELLGHASISTTQVYTKVSVERLIAAFEKAHPRRYL
jgi:integrase/recombinase XerD